LRKVENTNASHDPAGPGAEVGIGETV